MAVTESAQLARTQFSHHLFFPLHKARVYISDFSDNANIYGGAETNNEFLDEIGAELWTSLGDGEDPGSFYFHE